MAAHQWVRFGEDRENPFRRLRWCSFCGKIQEWKNDQWYMRIVRYYWWPNVGRCPGKGAQKKCPIIGPRNMDLEDYNQGKGL